MAKYQGAIISKTEASTLKQRVFTAIKMPIFNDNAILKQRVFDAHKMNLFLMGSGSGNGESSKKVRVLKGHTTWGEDSLTPRQYPLENSWRRR